MDIVSTNLFIYNQRARAALFNFFNPYHLNLITINYFSNTFYVILTQKSRDSHF